MEIEIEIESAEVLRQKARLERRGLIGMTLTLVGGLSVGYGAAMGVEDHSLLATSTIVPGLLAALIGSACIAQAVCEPIYGPLPKRQKRKVNGTQADSDPRRARLG